MDNAILESMQDSSLCFALPDGLPWGQAQDNPIAVSPCTAVEEPLAPDPAQIDSTLLLVGDAGEVSLPEDPVMKALLYEANRLRPAQHQDRMAIIFLGDNIYPSGMPLEETGPKYEQAFAILKAQADVALKSGAQAFFVPGNHDWHTGGDCKGIWNGIFQRGSYASVLQQAKALKKIESDWKGEQPGRLELLPGLGQPGLDTRPMGDKLELVFLDTNRWLIRKRYRPNPKTFAEFLKLLDAALEKAKDRTVIVLAHHPLQSGGPHGRQGFFLRSSQDLKHSDYKALIQGLDGIFMKHSPFLYAAGHDHSLQVSEGKSTQYHVVSGSGSTSKSSEVIPLETSLWSKNNPGFMRIDFLRDGDFPHAGEALLQVILPRNIPESCKESPVERPFVEWLKPALAR